MLMPTAVPSETVLFDFISPACDWTAIMVDISEVAVAGLVTDVSDIPIVLIGEAAGADDEKISILTPRFWSQQAVLLNPQHKSPLGQTVSSISFPLATGRWKV